MEVFGKRRKQTVRPDEIGRLPFAKKIAALNALAGKADPDCIISGAETHRYRFNPAASMQEVLDAQAALGVTFPEEYVQYLTQLGNGGPGPDYGLFPLERVLRENQHLLHQPLLGETWLDSTRTAAEWDEAMAQLQALADDDDAWDEAVGRLLRGALDIGTQGCTYDTLLLCSGRNAGEVVYIDWNLQAGAPPHFTGMTLGEWLAGYYEKLLRGEIIRHSDTLWIVKW